MSIGKMSDRQKGASCGVFDQDDEMEILWGLSVVIAAFSFTHWANNTFSKLQNFIKISTEKYSI